jgi:hypothetical protein
MEDDNRTEEEGQKDEVRQRRRAGMGGTMMAPATSL